MITITPVAIGRIHEFMEAEAAQRAAGAPPDDAAAPAAPALALRFGVQGRGPGGFQYKLAFVGAADRAPSDTVVDAGPFQVFIEADSVASLTGAVIDFVEGPGESGFKIDNPNPLWTDPVAQAVQKVLDDDINPAVGSHGGWVSLLDVKDQVAYVQLGGGCQGCGMADVTLKQGIEVRIKEMVPAIRGIVDTTDHAGGSNPYYRPAKGGASPYS